ncbi:RNA-binding protein [Bittarella sp. HCP28S3_D9]|uniref:YlmH family RNA-binding protein n=1 Tax=Bittarella sp. HCP28S3_D9 TaxID=3440253 RepID=UPI003F89A8A0
MRAVLPADEGERLFLRGIEEMMESCYSRSACKSTYFLDERQRLLCSPMLAAHTEVEHRFFGGHPECRRAVLAISGGPPIGEGCFPIRPLRFLYRKQDVLTHRDFLGALLSLEIERRLVGDIFVGEGEAVAFLHQNAAPLALEIKKVGRVGVRVEEGGLDRVPPQRFEEIGGTVASLRLDGVLGVLLRQSRGRCTQLVQAGQVQLNHREVLSPSEPLEEGDVLSVRGAGRFVLTAVGGLTKKGRLGITAQKYL